MPASPFNLPHIKIGSPSAAKQQQQQQVVQIFNTTDSRSPKYRRPGSVTGYTGHVSSSSSSSSEQLPAPEVEEAPSPSEKFMIRGYAGFVPTRRNVVGEPAIPSEDKQIRLRMEQSLHAPSRGSPMHRDGAFSPAHVSSSSLSPSQAPHTFSPYNNAPSPSRAAHQESYFASSPSHHEKRKSSGSSASSTASASTANSHEQAFAQFRNFARHMDTLERYNAATQQLLERGQSQEMLLRIVQSKLSERVSSYAWQQIRTRKLFEAFDFNGDGVLDENEFRVCLEKMNVQFDDVQSLALFAYFDRDNVGVIQWSSFANNAMVQNPRGATGVLPKMITSISTEPISVAAARRYPLAM